MKGLTFRNLIFILALFGIVPVVNATTFYVSNSGNDNNDGRSTSTAWATLKHAAESPSVVAGDVIEVMAGTYQGFIIGARRGTSWSPGGYITLRAYNNGAVTVQGNSGVNGVIGVGTNGCASDPQYGQRSLCYPSFWRIEGLDIDANGVYYAVKMESGGIKLINNKIHHSGFDLVKLVATSDDVEISGNEIYNSGLVGGNAQGIDIVGAKDTVIRNNYLHDITSIGVYPKGNAEDTIIEHNKLERIRVHAIQLGHPTDVPIMRYQGDPNFPYETYRARVNNNIVVGAGHACIGIANSYDAKVYNNSCYDVAQVAQHGAIHFSNESDHPAKAPSRNVELKNNIIHSRTRNVLVAYETGTPNAIEESTLSMDHNVFWTPSGDVRFDWPRILSTLATFDEWRQQTPYDDNSLRADPDYADTTELRLNTTSPAINRGTNNPCPPADYRNQTTRPQGTACDIGADEVGETTPPGGDTTAPTASMTAPASGATLSGQTTLSANASDNVAVTGVQFLVDGNAVGTEDTTAPYSITFDTTTLADGSHTFSARARDAAGNIGNAASVTANVQNGGSSGNCTRANAGQWQNTGFASQTGNFTAQWDARPLADNIDSLHALTLGPQTSWAGLAAIVRFNTTGTIDARNGSGYGALTSIPYSANNLYRIRTVVNVPSKTYSVYVTAPGGSEQLLAQNYAFRTEQQSVTSLNNFVVQAETGSSEACAFSVTTGGGTGTGQVVNWENNDARLTYSPIGTGHWSLNGSSTYASGGNYAVGNGAGAELTFSFTGTAVQWIALMDQYSGQARVTIDGVSEVVDTYRAYGAPGFGWQQVAWQKTGLTYGTHNVKIEVLGTKNPSSGGVGVGVDAFKITE